MNHVIILSYSDLIVIFIAWIIGTFIGGFINAWIKDYFKQKALRKFQEKYKRFIEPELDNDSDVFLPTSFQNRYDIKKNDHHQEQ